MQLLLYTIILVLVVSIHSEQNVTLIEDQCIDCTTTFENIFLKTIWFPIAPREYLCVNSSSNLSQHMLIVAVVCKPEMCKGITKRRAVKLWDPEILTCGCDEPKEFQEVLSTPSHQNVDIILIILAVLVFIATGIRLMPGRAGFIFNRWNGLVELLFPRGVIIQ
jgi:hypothetical protein